MTHIIKEVNTSSNEYLQVNVNGMCFLNKTINSNSIQLLKWKDGSYYIGEVVKNKANGLGIFSHSSGDKYKGYFENDVSSGFGIYSNLNNSNECISEWLDDKQNGYGHETWLNDSYYKGQFKDGLKNGYGVYVWNDGSIYEGEWRNGLLDGYGMYHFNKIKKYYGQWRNNLMNGYGEFYWETHMYIGFYVNDKKEGFGIYFWYDPVKIYIGHWKNGRQHGFGRVITMKSSKYGIWKEGRKEEEVDEFSEVVDECLYKMNKVGRRLIQSEIFEIKTYIYSKYLQNE